MRKKMLVLGGARYNVGVLEQLKELDCLRIVADRNASAPGLSAGDIGEVADISDRVAILHIARKHEINAVMATNDFGIRSAAHVACQLGLIGVSPDTAEVATDKGRMRDRWKAAGLPIPDYRVVTTLEEARHAAIEIGFPLVLKPTDSGGAARGVSIVHSLGDVDWAYEFAIPFVKNSRLILESFIEGTEMSVEAISHEGKVHILAMADKEISPQRTRVTTAINYPADFSGLDEAQVKSAVAAAVLALGIVEGPSHTEVIVGKSGPILVETAARPGGGHIFSHIVKAVSGVNMVKETGKLLLGEKPDLLSRHTRGCVYRFFNPEPGILKAVHGIDLARRLPGVLELGLTKAPGDTIKGLLNGLERPGFAVVEGKDREEAIRRANQVEQTVIFEILALS